MRLNNCLILCLLLIGSTNADTWYNTSFQYRVLLNLTNPTSLTYTDFIYNVTFDSKLLYDTGKINGTCNDLMFTFLNQTNSSEYEVPYFLYADNGIYNTTNSNCSKGNSKALVHVRIPILSANNNTAIYMYYGNMSVPSKSSPDAVYPWFDFQNGTSVGYKWLNGSNQAYDGTCATANCNITSNTIVVHGTPTVFKDLGMNSTTYNFTSVRNWKKFIFQYKAGSCGVSGCRIYGKFGSWVWNLPSKAWAVYEVRTNSTWSQCVDSAETGCTILAGSPSTVPIEQFDLSAYSGSMFLKNATLVSWLQNNKPMLTLNGSEENVPFTGGPAVVFSVFPYSINNSLWTYPYNVTMYYAIMGNATGYNASWSLNGGTANTSLGFVNNGTNSSVMLGVLAAGNYGLWIFGLNGSVTNATFLNFSIQKNSTNNLGITFNPASPITYEDIETTTGTGCYAELDCDLFFDNGTSIMYVPSNLYNMGVLPAGVYTVTTNTTGNTNYTAMQYQVGYPFIVNKRIPSLELEINPSHFVEYGTTTNASGKQSPNGLAFQLKRGGEAVSNPDIRVYGTGLYIYNFSTEGNQNYSANWTEEWFFVYPYNQTCKLYMNDTQGNITFIEGSTLNATGVPSNLTYTDGKIYVNGDLKANPHINSTLLNGTYNITYTHSGNENYTGCWNTSWLFVNYIPPPAFLINITSPLNNTIYNFGSNFTLNVSIFGSLSSYAANYSLDMGANTTLGGIVNGSYNWSYLGILQNGLHNITVYAWNGTTTNVSYVNFSVSNVISGCPITIFTSGNYDLAGNLAINGYSCINVSAANVDINGKNFKIIGNSTTGTYGIYSNQYNTTIKNIIVNSFSESVLFSNAQNGLIYASTFNNTYAGGYGIRLIDNSTRNLFANLTVETEGNYSYGMFFTLSDLNTIINVTSITNGNHSYGIYFNTTHDNFLLNNYAGVTKGNYSYGVYLLKSYNTTTDRITTSTTGDNAYGLYLYNSSNNYISELIVNTTGNSSYGIYLYNSSNNYMKDSQWSITTGISSYGFYLNGGNNNSISNISSRTNGVNAYGIYMERCTNNSLIKGSAITTIGLTGYSIYLTRSDYNNITDFYISTTGNGAYGVYFARSSNNTINNVISRTTGNESIGILFSLSQSNKINNLSTTTIGNDSYGVYFSTSNLNNLTDVASTTEGDDSWDMYFQTSTSNNLTRIKSNTYGRDAHNIYLYSSPLNKFGSSIFNSSLSSPVNIEDSDYNLFVNNTLITGNGSNNLLELDATSVNNTFYWNNFTNTSGRYINDSSGQNIYNSTVGGNGEGNIFFNVINDAVHVEGVVASAFGGGFLIGINLVYNDTTSLGKTLGLFGGDKAPLTTQEPLIGITWIYWVPPTPPNNNVTLVNWIFGNVTFNGSTPTYQTMILDLKNTTISCNATIGVCYKNNTALKRGWHSIQVYLKNLGGDNMTDMRHIFVNISEQNAPIIIMDEAVQAQSSNVYYIGGGLMLLVGGFMLYYRRKKRKTSYTIEEYDEENAYTRDN